ncbi:MAG: hypothetical protein ACK51V_01610 [bacterium]
MRIFIDTEFSDFKNPLLISIALVADDGREFYAELPVDQSRCNSFVLDTVLPLLGQEPAARCTPEELASRMVSWLLPYENQNPTLCYDFAGDWFLFSKALSYKVPIWLTPQNIYQQIDPLACETYLQANRLPQHHALYDARANQHAFNPHYLRIDPLTYPKSR